MSNENPSENTSELLQCLIGRNVVLHGDLTFTGGLHIDGTIAGDVIAGDSAPSYLHLSKHGVIKGNVIVDKAIIDGKVTGNIQSFGNIKINKKAIINGDVQYRTIEIEDGALINGELKSDQSLKSTEQNVIEINQPT